MPSLAAAHSDRASLLSERLIAPCCWTQTLDIHDSPLATSLRVEIQERLSRGEGESSIEEDLIFRYGEQMRAVPKGGDARLIVPAVVFALMATSLVGLLWLARKWRKRSRTVELVALPHTDASPDYDDRLNAELYRLND